MKNVVECSKTEHFERLGKQVSGTAIVTDVPDFLGHERRADELRSPPTFSGSEKDAALEQFAHTSKLQLPVNAFGSSVNTLKKKAIPLECNQMMREWARKGKDIKNYFILDTASLKHRSFIAFCHVPDRYYLSVRVSFQHIKQHIKFIVLTTPSTITMFSLYYFYFIFWGWCSGG